MKAKVLWVWLVLCGAAVAQTVFTNGIDVNNTVVRGVGLIDLSQTDLSKTPSVAQLMGYEPSTNGVIKDNKYLIPLCTLQLITDDIVARSTNGLALCDASSNVVVLIRNGALYGNGAGLTNLNSSQIMGLGSAAFLSSADVAHTDAAQLGAGATAINNSTALGAWSAATTNGVAVGQNANGNAAGTALGYHANGADDGVAMGVWANGSNAGLAIGDSANGSGIGTAVGISAIGTTYGVALGLAASGATYGVGIGSAANGANSGLAVGGWSVGTNSGVAVGQCAQGSTYGTAVGRGANGTDYGTAVGFATDGSLYGVAMGWRAYGATFGTALGMYATAPGVGNVALGGSDNSATAASVPTNWTHTIELGCGTATLQGALHFHGKPIVDTNGVIILRDVLASVCANNYELHYHT